MLASNVAEDGVGLGKLHITIKVVGKVWEVQAEGGLDAGPTSLVIVRGRATGQQAVLKLSASVLKE